MSQSIAGHEPDVVNWDVAARAAVAAGHWVHDSGTLVSLNLSVPDLSGPELAGVRSASLAPLGAIHTEVRSRDEEWLHLGFAETTRELPPQSDSRLVAEGHMVFTGLTGVRAAELDGEAELLAALVAGSDGLSGG
ncbi:MAG: hypothetical protein R2716_14170 [Microthrixaceae bacterium]